MYQPGLLFVPFGLMEVDEIVRPRRRQLRSGIVFHENEVESVSTERDEVVLDDGTVLPYDVLVVATGARLQPEETEGLTGPGWNERVFTFYDAEGATALRDALERFDGGRLVVNIADMPIKCPVAPIEFTFLADWFLRERDLRDGHGARARDAARRRASRSRSRPQHLTHLLAEKNIELVTEFTTGEVDGAAGRLVVVRRPRDPVRPARDGSASRRRRVRRALAGARGRSRLRPDRRRDAAGDREAQRLRPRRRDRSADVEGGLRHALRGRGADRERRAASSPAEELAAGYDGHSNCFVETGFHKALLIDFNYDTEPLPGHFPTAVGPAAAARVAG